MFFTVHCSFSLFHFPLPSIVFLIFPFLFFHDTLCFHFPFSFFICVFMFCFLFLDGVFAVLFVSIFSFLTQKNRCLKILFLKLVLFSFVFPRCFLSFFVLWIFHFRILNLSLFFHCDPIFSFARSSRIHILLEAILIATFRVARFSFQTPNLCLVSRPTVALVTLACVPFSCNFFFLLAHKKPPKSTSLRAGSKNVLDEMFKEIVQQLRSKIFFFKKKNKISRENSKNKKKKN